MTFTVYGPPVPQGSMKAFRRGAKTVVTSDNNRLKPWRQEVTIAAMQFREYFIEAPGAVSVTVDCFFQRPKSVSEKKRPHHTVKPDADKLARAIFDALTGVLFTDDSQVVKLEICKWYGTPERAEITVKKYGGEQ